MSYGSEIWGLNPAADHCEKVHLLALKKNLNVSLRTPNDFIYKEVNRYPVKITLAINCIRYWFKVISMSEDRLPRKAYAVLFDLDIKGKISWATHIKRTLFQYGFGYVWEQQGVGDLRRFLQVFKQRLIDCRWQNWSEHVNDSDRFSLYRSFCTHLDHLPKYICVEMNKHVKLVMSKFRFGVSSLNVHHFRYRFHQHKDLICPMCKTDIENEIHFLLCCPFLDRLREKFIPLKFYRSPCISHFNMLMSCTNDSICKKLCLFVYFAFKTRETVVS